VWWRLGRKKAGSEDPEEGGMNDWIDTNVEKLHCRD
jgi:hypothetical protein